MDNIPERITVLKAVRRAHFVDPWFCSLYSCSPYRACGHGCVYCDGRAEKYHVDGDFEKPAVRENFPVLLRKELPLLREKGIIVVGSGITDVYQPAERKEKMMPRCLEIFLNNRFPVMVLTKSSLVERDLPLYRELSEKNGFILLVTVVTLDENIRRALEPGASPISERLDVIRRFSDAGCRVGALAMPILPGLGDSPAELEQLYKPLKGNGVSCVMTANLTLRPGRQKDLYFSTIKKFRPDLSELYQNLYRENRPSGNLVYEYRDRFYSAVSELLEKLRLPGIMPHSLIKGYVSLCDEINIILDHLIWFYEHRSPQVGRLKTSVRKYESWLKETRVNFNRKRSLPPDYPEIMLRNIISSKKIDDIIQNRKLSAFLEDMVMNDRIWDCRDGMLKTREEINCA